MTGSSNIDKEGLADGPWEVCPYCGGPPRDPSEEHVVPVSIGGKGMPPIQGVCRECNALANRLVDQRLAQDRFIYAERMRLCVEGRRSVPSGRVLDVVEVEVLGPGERVLKHRVSVLETPTGISGAGLVSRTEGPGWLVVTASSKEDAARQMSKERRRLNDLGLSFTEKVEEGVVQMDLRYRLPPQGGATYDKAVAKTALAFTPRVLGEEWSTGDAAGLLRQVMNAANDEERAAVKVGRQIYPVEAQFSEQFELRDLHVLGLVPGEASPGSDCTVCFLSLFGRMLGAVEVADFALPTEGCPIVLVDPVESSCIVLSLDLYLDLRPELERRLAERAGQGLQEGPEAPEGPESPSTAAHRNPQAQWTSRPSST